MKSLEGTQRDDPYLDTTRLTTDTGVAPRFTVTAAVAGDPRSKPRTNARR